MKKISVALLFTLVLMGNAYPFEIDGLKSGISLEEAKQILQRYSYSTIEIKENHIGAWDYPEKGTGRAIFLNFCKGKLVQLQKHLKPRFDYFVRLVDEKRTELGRPIDAWSRPTNITSNIESNSISLLWKVGNTFITVSYTQF